MEEYKHFMEQIAKQKMNFIGLHTYHNEPTVWQVSCTNLIYQSRGMYINLNGTTRYQDSASTANFDPISGNITKVVTYPGTQYTYTTTLGGWGNAKQGAGWSGESFI